MIIRPVIALLIFALSPAAAQFHPGSRPQAIVEPFFDIIFPHVVSGGSWTTRITLMNMESAPARGSVLFSDTQGDELFLEFTGIDGPVSLLDYTIPANGAISIETVPSANIQQGYALLAGFAPFGNERAVSGIVVFRQTVEGRPPFEASVPLSPITERRFRIPFDNTGGYQTGIALTVPGIDSSGGMTSTPTRIEAQYWDDSGVPIGSASFHVPAFGQEAFALSAKFPALAGRRGVIEFRSTGELMAAMGLRFHPGGAFTSLPTASLVEWHSESPGVVASRP